MEAGFLSPRAHELKGVGIQSIYCALNLDALGLFDLLQSVRDQACKETPGSPHVASVVGVDPDSREVEANLLVVRSNKKHFRALPRCVGEAYLVEDVSVSLLPPATFLGDGDVGKDQSRVRDSVEDLRDDASL